MMTKTKQLLLIPFILFVGITLSLAQTTTTSKEVVTDEDGNTITTTTTTTTTKTTTEVIGGQGFSNWHELDCSTNVKKIPVKRIQESLRGSGYYKGSIDGIIGPMTRAAVTKFRKDNGYSATFLVDECTLGLMGIIVVPD